MARDRTRMAHRAPPGRGPVYRLGGQKSTLPTVALSVLPGSLVFENAGTITFRITFSQVPPPESWIHFRTENDTALAGTDYTPAIQGDIFVDGRQTIDLPAITIINREGTQGDRSFNAYVENSTVEGSPIFTITTGQVAVTIRDVVEGASPLEAALHPRIFIVPDAYEGVTGGISVSTLRTRILAHYPTEFNATVAQVNGRLSLDPATAPIDPMFWDAAWTALFALLDPATMPTIANFSGQTQAGYLAACKAKLLAVAARNWRVTSTESPDTAPVSVMGACAYDWSQAADASLWTDADRQQLAEAVIIGTRIRADVVTNLGLTETSQKTYSRITPIALALANEPISGNSTDSGQPYTDEMTRIAALCRSDHEGMLSNGTFLYGDRAACQDGPMYATQMFKSFLPTLSILSTAYGYNYLAETPWLREYPIFLLTSTIPIEYTGTVPRADGVRYKDSSDYELSVGQASSTLSQPMVLAFFGEMLRAAEPVASQMAAWWRQQRHDGLQSSSTMPTNQYLFYHFLAGARHLPTAPSPSTLGLPLSRRFGLNQYFFRETHDFDPTGTVAWFSALNHHLGGHQEQHFGTFALWRAGNLLVNGGVHKNYGSYPGMSANHGSTMDHGRFRILDTTLAPNSYGLLEADNVARNGAVPVDPRVSEVNAYNAGEVLADDLNRGTFDYVKYDQTRTWPLDRATYHLREFFFLRPVNGGRPYVVLWDRVTVVNPAIHIPFQNQKWVYRPAAQDGSETLIDGPGTGDPANPDSEGASGEYQSTAATLYKMTHTTDGANGVLWMKVLLPESADVRVIGGDYNWCVRDATPGGRLDSNREDGVDLGSNDDKTGETYMMNVIARWSGRWRTEVRAATPATDQQFLSVFAPGLADTHVTVPDMALVTGATMRGAVIFDPARTRVVVGPVAHTGTVATAWSITLPSGATTPAHLVAVGLPPSTAYAVSRVDLTITATPGSGTSLTSSAGVLEVSL